MSLVDTSGQNRSCLPMSPYHEAAALELPWTLGFADGGAWTRWKICCLCWIFLIWHSEFIILGFQCVNWGCPHFATQKPFWAFSRAAAPLAQKWQNSLLNLCLDCSWRSARCLRRRMNTWSTLSSPHTGKFFYLSLFSWMIKCSGANNKRNKDARKY